MRQWWQAMAVVGVAATLAACGTQRPAPVVDRTGPAGVRPDAAATSAPTVSRSAKDGVYTVQRGDTLFSIAASFGVDVRDLARWNSISDSSSLAVGQTLRIIAPPDAAATVTPVAPAGTAEVRPLPLPGMDPGAAPVPAPAPGTATAPTLPGPTAAPPEPARPVPEVARPAVPDGAVQWQWPVTGKLIENFDETRNKGIDLAGNDGEPVNAAADGEVVYVGSALRGYGNLVIVKHNDEFISAYAHNRQILVKQGQSVKRGQRIAEMGRSDADRTKLHFEIRRQGKPVDPLRYLPPR